MNKRAVKEERQTPKASLSGKLPQKPERWSLLDYNGHQSLQRTYAHAQSRTGFVHPVRAGTERGRIWSII
jgi:hypothetical protein